MMSPRLLYGMELSWWEFAPQSVELSREADGSSRAMSNFTLSLAAVHAVPASPLE
jgi:hypothetical protein